MKKIALFSLIILAALTFGATSANADQYGCNGQYGQYGGCPSNQSILIDKTVSTPTSASGSALTASYVDNLSSSDARYRAGQQVFFKLKVKNTSNNKITNVTVKDFVPTYVEPVEGPGTYDSANRVVTFNVGDFESNEEKVFYLKMQVVAQNSLPSDKSLLCLTNRAQAFNNQVSNEDTAQFCIEKQVTGVISVPSTGPEFGIVLIGAELAALGAGFMLKKRS